MSLHDLRPAKGSKHARRRLGRGQGSGRGGTSTRGHKGAQSRSGYARKIGFEGGQQPLQRRVPKLGVVHPVGKIRYKVLNLDSVQSLVEKKPTDTLNLADLRASGLVSGNEKVKVLARGALRAKLSIEAHAFSNSAKLALEKTGGKAIVCK